jgi:hypothetical protein
MPRKKAAHKTADKHDDGKTVNLNPHVAPKDTKQDERLQNVPPGTHVNPAPGIPQAPAGKAETRLFQINSTEKVWLTEAEAKDRGFHWGSVHAANPHIPASKND